MKRPFDSLVATLLLSGTLLLSAGMAEPAPQYGAPQEQREMNRGGKEQHPEIRDAIRALENARNHLQKAAHDFGGHRAKALEHVNQALEECRQALQYDKKWIREYRHKGRGASGNGGTTPSLIVQTLSACHELRVADLLCDYPARNAVTSISCWIGLHVVRLGMNDQRSAAVAVE